MKTDLSRREFLWQTGAATLASTMLSGALAAGADAVAAAKG